MPTIILEATVALLVATSVASMAGRDAPQAPKVGISPGTLLELASTIVAPTYPPASVEARRQGLVAASVLVGANGQLEEFELLESPDPEMGAATRRALERWRFKPLTAPGGQIAQVKSKVFFYFVISEGLPFVLTPNDMAQRNKAESASPADVPVGAFPVMTDAEWERDRLTSPRPILLDVRNRPAFGRSHSPEALNIPENELSIRGPAELPPGRRIVIDCRPDTGDLCGYAARILARRGFRDVRVLTRSRRTS